MSILAVTMLCCCLHRRPFTSSFSLCSGPWHLMTKEICVIQGGANTLQPQPYPSNRTLSGWAFKPWVQGLQRACQAPCGASAGSRGGRRGCRPRAGPRSGSALLHPTAAPRLRAEAPVGREVSRSSWHGLIEQPGFVSVDSCGDGGWLRAGLGAGWGPGFGSLRRARPKPAASPSGQASEDHEDLGQQSLLES